MKENDLPAWDLKDLYRDESDPLVKKHLSDALKKALQFEKKYRGKLKPDPKTVLAALKEYEAIHLIAVKPVLYSNLLFSESSAPQGRGAFMQNVRASYLNIHQQLLFFELELLNFSVKELNRLKDHTSLHTYSHYLEQLVKAKPHRLSEREERILSDKNHTGSHAFMRLFDQEFADRQYSLMRGKKETKVSETEILSHIYSPDRELRAEVARSFTVGLKEDAKRLTYIFNILAEDKAIDDRYRNFESPEDSRHLTNEIDQSMVDAMTHAVVSKYSVVQDFYKFKRKVLKTKELFDYDRYAPVESKIKPIPFSKARELVLDSFYEFDKEIGDIAKLFFDKRWIDAAKRPGKRGGAFCSFITPDLHPYVFINYTGTVREVSTLAHELGHAIHAYLMRGQSYLNFDTPLTIAETASVFAEMLLFERMKGAIKDKDELFSLYMSKIESIFATVFRQISLYRFEQLLHKNRREKGELSTEAINGYWRSTQEEMFGRSITLTKDYDYWWSYIPHFIHSPFYVYAYAFGELLTLSLFAQYKKEGKKFVPKYKKLLMSGNSIGPEAALKPFALNLRDISFWRQGIRMVEEMVQNIVK